RNGVMQTRKLDKVAGLFETLPNSIKLTLSLIEPALKNELISCLAPQPRNAFTLSSRCLNRCKIVIDSDHCRSGERLDIAQFFIKRGLSGRLHITREFERGGVTADGKFICVNRTGTVTSESQIVDRVLYLIAQRVV